MVTSTRLRDVVVQSRQRLADDRVKLRQQHLAGSPGIQVCSRLTDTLDQIVLSVYEAALADLDHDGDLASHFALVPHGGYGRRDVAPFSDVDLLLLRDRRINEYRTKALSGRIVEDLSDVGLSLGFSVRTPREAIQFARRDPIIFTSQAESRFLAGSIRLFSRYIKGFRRYAKRNAQSLIRRIEQSRTDERARFGETIYLLEPNIKRSRGGLRDIHLLRWIGFAGYGESQPSRLSLLGVLGREDERTIRKATEFLLHLRNEMHFQAGKTYDVLHRAEQMRIAKTWQYKSREGVLPVEEFMRDYFRHTRNVRDVVGYFLADAKQRPWVQKIGSPLVTQRYDEHFRIGPIHIAVTNKGLKKLRGNLTEVLRLMELASQTNKRIEHRTWAAIRDDMSGSDNIEVTSEAAGRFLSLLNYSSGLGNLLRRLHELRVLDKLVSGMGHSRGLLQFNRYHQYTVDEHCIRAVERAIDFQGDASSLGEAYRGMRQRNLLHLALLIHDLGKGFTEDHSEVGLGLAVQTARRLGLSERDSQLLQFLVHKHLLMSHLTFRRDTSDESFIIDFATEVGSAEYLRMLYVMTAADLAAVGPGVLTPWKIDVLTDVYHRSRDHLAGGGPTTSPERGAESIRVKIHAQLAEDPWYAHQIDALPPSYLRECDQQTIVHDLQKLRHLAANSAIAWGRYLPDRQVTEYTVGVHEEPRPGVFHWLTGTLTSHRLRILSAQIHTLSDGFLLDRFCVEDDDHAGPPPDSRIDEVSGALTQSLDPNASTVPVFRRVWKETADRMNVDLEVLPTRVSIDNSTSPDCTIVDVFTHDWDGLLYEITRALYELNTSVRYAKIGTYLDQVVDVFYLTDLNGNKILDEQRLAEIQQGLAQAIEASRTT